MKAKPSLRAGCVVFEISSRDVTLLAVSETAKQAPVGTAEEKAFEQLYERATRLGSLLDEILARPIAPAHVGNLR